MSLSNEILLKSYDASRGSTSDIAHELEVIRGSLGAPLNAMPQPIQCIVASDNGLDAETAKERFVVTSRLWSEGISCEYLAQSGLMASLLKQQREELKGDGTSVSLVEWKLFSEQNLSMNDDTDVLTWCFLEIVPKQCHKGLDIRRTLWCLRNNEGESMRT